MSGIVGARSGDHRYFARNTFNAEDDRVFMLPVRESASLACRTGDYKRVDPPGELKVNQPAKGIPINPFFSKGSDNRGSRARKDRVLHTGTPPELND